MRRFDLFEGGLLASRDSERIAFEQAVAEAASKKNDRRAQPEPQQPPLGETVRQAEPTRFGLAAAIPPKTAQGGRATVTQPTPGGRRRPPDIGRICQIGTACLVSTLSVTAGLCWEVSHNKGAVAARPVVLAQAEPNPLPTSAPAPVMAVAPPPPPNAPTVQAASDPADAPEQQTALTEQAPAAPLPPLSAKPLPAAPSAGIGTALPTASGVPIVAPSPHIMRVLARLSIPRPRLEPAIAHAEPPPRPDIRQHPSPPIVTARLEMPEWLLRPHPAAASTTASRPSAHRVQIMSPQPHDLDAPAQPAIPASISPPRPQVFAQATPATPERAPPVAEANQVQEPQEANEPPPQPHYRPPPNRLAYGYSYGNPARHLSAAGEAIRLFWRTLRTLRPIRSVRATRRLPAAAAAWVSRRGIAARLCDRRQCGLSCAS